MPVGLSMSKFNQTEAMMVVELLSSSQISCRGKSVMVITFYKDMMKLLVQLAEDAGFNCNKPGSTLRIVTVDSAQGSEADVVVLSSVRSNMQHYMGFLSNTNRMCVAVSRAKERLVIVGHGDTLR